MKQLAILLLALAVIYSGYNLSQGVGEYQLLTLIICSLLLFLNSVLLILEQRKKNKLSGHDNPNKSTGNKYVDKL